MALYDKGSPIIRQVKEGETVYLCRCGKSSNPLGNCDGSHDQAAGEGPLAHTVESGSDGKLYLCGCGKSKRLPWCDGSHQD
ncbi:MAG: CDGSH iron-sulfur domain-containing protein [Gammaproteobacteria bacterium]|nr:CDGSH iron-sulfur domain-containing protein [Gammaproteobacteria bacterium]